MDNKNVFVAIALSMAVLLFWGALFEQPKPLEKNSIQQEDKQKKITENNNIEPSINESLKIEAISREESINKSSRIKIENENIIGSISLKGALIDDVSFKKHKQNLQNNENVKFLNPKETKDGYFIETGWTSIGNKIKVPSNNSIWKIDGNKTLSKNNPILLQWNNQEGLIFKKKIEIDDKYLFTISQEIKNNTDNIIDLYPYAQITRNKIPDDIQNFYISHEGFIGVFDEELKEDDYDDIEEKKIVRQADEGWFGITD
jgi:YidC/Oxa1 family membrane protein insertase